MVGTKRKTSKPSLSYFRTFGTGNKGVISGNNDDDDLDIYQPLDNITKETQKRNKLYTALTVAKQNKDQVMINKIEKELGIRKDDEETNTNDFKDIIEVLKIKLMDPNIDSAEHDKVLKTLAALQIGKGGGNAAVMAMLTSSNNQQSQPKKDEMSEITNTLLKSLIENKTKESSESDMDKFIKYQKFLNENTADPMTMIKDAKETLKLIGVDTDGTQNLSQLQMKLEEKKLDKEYSFREKELEAKQESNKLMGGWIKELSSAVVEGIVDSIDDDDDDDDEDDDEEKPKNKDKKKTTSKYQIKVKCFNCKKQTEVKDPSESREIVCEHCNWPHYFVSETKQVKSITADNVRTALKMEPKEFLDQYKPGDLEEMLNEENESDDDNEKED